MKMSGEEFPLHANVTINKKELAFIVLIFLSKYLYHCSRKIDQILYQ